jgi:SAM-dependent methyltransferase
MKSFDRVAEAYDASRGLPAAAAADVNAGILAALRDVTTSPRLLEVGIGTGRIAVPLAEAGVSVVGIDIAARMLARLRAKRSDLLVLRAEAARLPFRPGCFDAALFVHVLHLVPDAHAVLRAAAACVRPGGLLLLGRTDFGASPRHTVTRWIAELHRELAGVEPPPDRHALAREAFRANAAELGTEVFSRTLASWQESRSARELLDALAGRLYSSTWDIPDAVLPELVRRLTPRVEELFGGLDRPSVTGVSFALDACRVGPAPR